MYSCVCAYVSVSLYYVSLSLSATHCNTLQHTATHCNTNLSMHAFMRMPPCLCLYLCLCLCLCRCLCFRRCFIFYFCFCFPLISRLCLRFYFCLCLFASVCFCVLVYLCGYRCLCVSSCVCFKNVVSASVCRYFRGKYFIRMAGGSKKNVRVYTCCIHI